MPDLSNAEISVEGEYGECLVCGELFHWEQLTLRQEGPYCDTHKPDDPTSHAVTLPEKPQPGDWLIGPSGLRVMGDDDEGDMGHDTALERDTFGDTL